MPLVQQPDSYYERIGGNTSPPKEEHFAEGVARDPVQDKLLAMATIALNYDLGGSTSTVTTQSLWYSVRSQIPSLNASQPVADTRPMLALPEMMRQREYGLPCLFLDRFGEQSYVEVTDDDQRLRSNWLMTWLLGPLSIGEATRVRVLCTKIVPMIIQRLCRHRCHPKYNSGFVQFGSDDDSLTSIAMTGYSADPTPLPDQATESSPFYWGVGMTLQTEERTDLIDDAFKDMLPGTYRLNVGGLDGTVKDMVIVEN